MKQNRHFTAVFEHESNGTVSAWVVELPGVYAAADTLKGAKSAILEALEAHLATLSELRKPLVARSEIAVVRYDAASSGAKALRFVGLGALLGRKTSKAKAAAARKNGLKGGRPSADLKPRPTHRTVAARFSA